MTKVIHHNRKEIKHIKTASERSMMNTMKNQVKVNNQVIVNKKRYNIVAIGYLIQVRRMVYWVQKLSKNIELLKKSKDELDQATNLMKKIQQELVKMEVDKKEYDKHLHDSYYCKMKIGPYVKQLENITEEVDVFVRGQTHE